MNSIPKQPLSFVWFASRPFFWNMLGAFVGLLAATVVNAAEPFIYRRIIDAFAAFAEGGDPSAIWLAIAMFIGVAFLGILFWRLTMIAAAPWLSGIRATARTSLSEYLLDHSHAYFEGRFAGSTANKVSHAADGARGLAESATIDFAPVILGMLFGIGTAFYANPILGLVFTGWLAVAIPVNVFLSRKRIPYTLEAQRAETKLRGVTVDIMSNMRAVQEFAGKRHELSLLAPLIAARRRAGIRNHLYGQTMVFINGVMYVAFLGAMLAIVAHLVVTGEVSVGTVALVIALTMNVGEHVFSLGWRLSSIAEAWGEVQEGLDDILREHDIDVTKGHDAVLRGDIQFVDTSFGYGDITVLSNFNLTIREGERVGFVGRSGAGKTTVAKLLLRHMDVGGGSIMIGNTNIASVSLEALRRNIAIIPQESSLFHRSIRENIAYGRPDATAEEVERAAKLAEAHEFITLQKEGYDTIVGERGVKLSGGQRQRIAIARAILKNAPILVLDEATSALDSESEVAIQQALHELMTGKTVIAIAHRLSTLREMDRIIVLDQGRIIEKGSHDALVANGGIYARLWEHQAGGFLQE